MSGAAASASTQENPFNLTPKELLFVELYCGEAKFHASKAYELAGYRARGASLSSNASRMLRSDRVSAAIHARVEALRHQARLDGDKELALLETIQNFNVQDVLDPLTGEILPVHKWPREAAAALKAMRPSRNGVHFEFEDKIRAVEIRLRAANRLVQRHEVKVARTSEDILAEVNALEQDGARG